MSASSGTPAEQPVTPLSVEEFTAMARRLDVDPTVLDELYPMVRDLLAFAGRLNRLAPELGAEIDVGSLTSGGMK